MELLYRKLQENIKSQIIAGIYKVGALLPSESDMQQIHSVTRSTVRQALSELVKEGYIQKKKGKGSIVVKRMRRTLGVLSVKGFSEIVSENKLTVSTIMIKKPHITRWEDPFCFPIDDLEMKAGCIYLKRLRCVEAEPVMLETTFIPNMNLPGFCSKPFVKGSLFETLSINYSIEINKVEQDLRAVLADKEVAALLKVIAGSPLLQIFLKFYTNREYMSVYSSLLCNTTRYSIGNKL